MEPEPLFYAAPEQQAKKRRTNFGAIALALSILFMLMNEADAVIPHGRTSSWDQNISNFVFDYGALYLLLTLLLIVVGLIQGGRSRWCALAAFGIPCILASGALLITTLLRHAR